MSNIYMSGPGSNPRGDSNSNPGPTFGLGINPNPNGNAGSNARAGANGNGNAGAGGDGDVSPKRADASQHIRLPDHLIRPHLTAIHRTLSDAVRAVRSREEQETLLDADEEDVDPDGCVREDGGLMGPRGVFCPDPHEKLPVYYTIHR